MKQAKENNMEEKNAALNERIDIAKIGRRIMAMRLANGMTRAELAEKVEKSNQTLASNRIRT